MQILLLVCLVTLKVWSNKALLLKADSLFNQRKLTQAINLYDSLYSHYKVFSPSMLLKMAYIYEGRGEIFKTLYFLNVYNLHFPSYKVFKKMETLAQRNNLKGYEYSDWEYFIDVYNQYYIFIDWLMFIICLGLAFFILVRYFQTRQIKLVRIYLLVMLTFFSLLLLNIGLPSYKALVVADQALGMQNPSSASRVLSIIPQGNLVNVLNKEGVWYEVLYENQRLYIREDLLYMVTNQRIREQFRSFDFFYDVIKRLVSVANSG